MPHTRPSSPPKVRRGRIIHPVWAPGTRPACALAASHGPGTRDGLLAARRERCQDEGMVGAFDPVRAELLGFVCRTFLVSEAEIDPDRSLVDQGIIDSFGLVEITAFIEQRLGVVVRDEDMTREKFGSLNKMAAFVAGARTKAA